MNENGTTGIIDVCLIPSASGDTGRFREIPTGRSRNTNQLYSDRRRRPDWRR